MSGESPGRGPDAVCKLGGSLVDAGAAPAVLAALEEVASASRGPRVLVVPGGGRAADRVRAAYLRGGMTEREAHWKALEALDGVGARIARMNGGPPLPVVRDRDRLAPALDAGGLAVLAPRDPLRRAEAAAREPDHDPRPPPTAPPPLPHTWKVTSDSVAVWFALLLGAPRVVLIKARDGTPPEAGAPGRREPDPVDVASATRRRPAEDAAEEGLVDAHLPELLSGASLECRIVNGRHPERLTRLLRGETSLSTELT